LALFDLLGFEERADESYEVGRLVLEESDLVELLVHYDRELHFEALGELI